MKDQQGFTTKITIAGLILFLVLLALYVLFQPPLAHAAKNSLPLLSSLVLLLSFAGWGSLISLRLARSHPHSIQFLIAAALGIGLTGTFIFLLGMTIGFHHALLIAWALAGIVLFLRALQFWRIRVASFQPFTSWDKLAAAILFLFLVTLLPFVVAPEATRDALEYHLLIPRLYLQMNQISFLPLLLESNYPSLIEYVFLFVMRMAGDIACKAFHFWTGILLLWMMICITRKVSPQRGLLSAAFFLSMPVVCIVMGGAWNDLPLTLFMLTALYFLVNYHMAEQGTKSDSDLLMAGIAAGFASWTKYTFFIFFVALVLLWILGIRNWSWDRKKTHWLFLPILAISIMWAGKNFLFTGNPVFPFLNGIFHSPQISANAAAYFQNSVTRYEISNWNWATFFQYPFLITLKPNIIDVHTGILPLISLPLFFYRGSKGLSLLKWYVFVFMLAWLGFQTLVRSIFSVLAVIAIVGAVVFQEIHWPRRWLQSAFQALISLAVMANFVVVSITTFFLFDPLKYFIGQESRSQYLMRQAKSQATYDYLNNQKEAGRVLLVGLHNPYYLRKEALFSSCCDLPVAESLLQKARTAEELAALLKQSGVTHIVFNQRAYLKEIQDSLYSWTPQQRSTFESFLSSRCKPAIQFGLDRIYILL